MKSKIILSALAGTAFLIANNYTFRVKTINDQTYANAYLGDGITDVLFNQLVTNISNDTYIDSTYASYYFNNLRENFGNNAYGSCGYVSIGMLLSFYDAYWDDSIISNQFDINAKYCVDRQESADFDLIPTNVNSPGIQFESSALFAGYDIDDYLDFADQNKDVYFQFTLFDLAKKCFGKIPLDKKDKKLGLGGQEIYELLNYYFHDCKGFSNSEISVNIYTRSNVRSANLNLKNSINNGKPVILIVKSPSTLECHSVIAYDYNQSTGDIYVHTGWRSETSNAALTHVSLNDLGFTDIINEISIDISTNKNLGAKYYSENSNDSYTSSAFIFPREIKIKSGNYADLNPTFVWKSLFQEKWEEDKNPYFSFSILNSEKRPIIEVKNIQSLSYTLTDSQWEDVRFKISGEKYYVFLVLGSDNYQSWDDYWCISEFTKPNLYVNRPYILPDEYGFGDAYPTDEKTKTDFSIHTIRNFTFATRRYRVGYIHNEDIVMSPIRKGINEAFIEYQFDTALTRIDVELSYWREQAIEWLSNSNGTAAIQQYIGNEWVTVLDLLSSETNLSTNRNDKSTYKIEFSQPAYRIRFYSYYNGVSTNENNRGRICIGSMSFYESEYNLPLSGFELEYNPDLWSGKVESSNNCYDYALNNQVIPGTNKLYNKQHPGEYAGSLCTKYNKENLVNAVKADFMKYNTDFGTNLIFEEIGRNDKCPKGTYKVALVYFYGDYHWYRQDPDGYWSHKRGTEPVERTDYSNNLIIDPYFANRGSYTNFAGYFALSPWSNLYVQ